MKHFGKALLLFSLLMLCSVVMAQTQSDSISVLLSKQDFSIANVDNMFIPISNPSLLGTGFSSGIGLAYLNDEKEWQNHYWIFVNTDYLSYIYERDSSDKFHTLAVGTELFPAYILPNLYVGTNYRWPEGIFEDGSFRSAVTYRPHNSTSLAFTWDNPNHQSPYYRLGLAVRPFTFIEAIEDYRLELSVDANYARFDKDKDYEIKKPIIGLQTQILDGVKIGATYNFEEEAALVNFSLYPRDFAAGGLLHSKDKDNYGIAWAQFTDLNYKPFLGYTKPSWYKMDLSGNVVTYAAPKYKIGHLKIYDTQKKSIETLIEDIQKAKDDPEIEGILLKNPTFSTSMALQEELVDAFKDFKSSGKKVSFYYNNISNGSYIFASSIADKIYINPSGSVDLRGLSISSPYMKNMLSSLGIEVLNFRSHEYKDAGNMFSEEKMTPAEREAYNSLLQSLYAQILQRIDAGRGDKLTASVEEIINEGPYLVAEDALEKGLVDELIYEDQLAKQLKKDFHFSKQQKEPTEYCDYAWTKPKENLVAVIYANGNIVMGKGTPGQKIAQETTVNLIRKARKDDLYQGIILRVDSGGGSAQASDIILRELELAKTVNKKPVVVSMAGTAASGGYYISCNADKIVAEPSTLTGSIGVLGLMFNATEMFHKIKVNWDTVKKGEHADLGSLSRPWTDEEKHIITRSIEYCYDDFVKKVDEGRSSMNLEQVKQYAQGRIWTGEQAYSIGLVDELGGMDTAKDIMQELIGKKGKLTLVDATTDKEGVTISVNFSELNAYTPVKAFDTINMDYIKLYELWNDFGQDKTLMLSPLLPESLQF
ncbi:MAG TPA: signal peptide peptidase SppA [Candidatus Cloacimonas sp.]|nr:signal peptide peptidase SppA [Candidatus Cloacimonas sp.]